jgi:methionyl-tRNA formyltransferase
VRAIFFGTPEIAVPSLDALAEIAEIVGVVCQPDRPSGRGMKMQMPPVKSRAEALGLDVFQPTRVRDGTLSAWIRERSPDLALVIAYGRILARDTLTAPRLGCLNLHASVLPELRGAAPIQRALMEGKTETGVCLMQMDEGMDTGDVLACHTLPILDDDDAGTLSLKLGELARVVTKVEVPRFVRGELDANKQDHSRATYAPPLTKEETRLTFNRSPLELVNRIRGLAPRPGAWCEIKGKSRGSRLKIQRARVWVEAEPVEPGRALWVGGNLLVGAQGGCLQILLAQPEGKKMLTPEEMKNGRVLLDGDELV